MKSCLRRVQPKQPEFLITTNSFHKVLYMQESISHFYSFNTNTEEHILSAIPDGCVDILFCCDENPYAVLAGTVLKPTPFPQRNNAHYFGVRLLPGINPKLDKILPSDLVEKVLDYGDAFSNTDLISQIASCSNMSEQISIFLNFWRNNMNLQSETLSPQDRLNNYLVNEIVVSNGNIHISKLSENSGYSVRYLTEVFTSKNGVSPKTFGRLVRFQYFLNNFVSEIENDTLNLAELSAQCGYYDQPHMTRDFKQLIGTAPVKYMKHLELGNYNQMLSAL